MKAIVDCVRLAVFALLLVGTPGCAGRAADRERALSGACVAADDELDAALERNATWWAVRPDRGEASSHVGVVATLRRYLAATDDPRTRLREGGVRRGELESALAFEPIDDVLFTAYYAPERAARRAPTTRFRFPLYGRPPDLAPTYAGDGSWPDRASIEADPALAGPALVWLDDELDAYLIHVNGSARLRLADGNVMCLGHDGTNGRAYTSLGRRCVETGLIAEEDVSIPAIRSAYERAPATVRALMLENERYVFFREIPAARWPVGSQGLVLTPNVSVAVDPAVHAPGSVLLVETMVDGAPYVRFMIAQDQGAAIRGPQRVDLFFGVGDAAGVRAGRHVSTGRVWRITPIPEPE